MDANCGGGSGGAARPSQTRAGGGPEEDPTRKKGARCVKKGLILQSVEEKNDGGLILNAKMQAPVSRGTGKRF